MIAIYELSKFIFNLLLPVIIFYSIFLYITALANIFANYKSKHFKAKSTELPFITVQIPVYNDPIAVRCIEKCLRFDYPKDKYEIVVADDSTDVNTINLLAMYKDKVKIIHRKDRRGFKAGALNHALKYSKGDVIVIFDSDFTPPKNFLKKIVEPMLADEKVAIVQSRMGYINPNMNIFTRFSSTLLMIYHNIWIPILIRLGSVFFNGTGGAIKKSVLIKAGGWNENSLTEDADLSVKILDSKHKIVYLPNLRADGEVPFTFKSFIKQQMRWTYGLVRVFIDNKKTIFFSKTLSIFQRAGITLATLSIGIAPFVILVTIFGQLMWITGEPKPLAIDDVIRFFSILLFSAGFIATGALALYREKYFKNFLIFIFATYTIGLALTFYNSIALGRAIFNRKMIWYRTPKWGSLMQRETA